jgi:hypothetical protein
MERDGEGELRARKEQGGLAVGHGGRLAGRKPAVIPAKAGNLAAARVITAEAGISGRPAPPSRHEVPAFAGMTG